MIEEINSADVTAMKNDLDRALSALDNALSEAGRSVAGVRNSVAQVVEIAEQSKELEAAIARAREQLTLTIDRAPTTQLRAIPPAEPVAEFAQEMALEPPEQEAEAKASTGAAPLTSATRCLRLAVTSKSGNLDLKEVDGSVNENSSVIDVALLDYDGRQATLKLWINDASDPEGVREALLSSLKTHLGEKDTDVNIELDEENAA